MTFNPIVCQTCTNQIIGVVYPIFLEMIKNGVHPKDAIDKLGIDLKCCISTILSHVDYMENLY